MDEQLETMEQLKVTIIDVAVRFGPKLLAAILVLVVGILLSRWLGRWFDRGVARIELEPPIRLLLSRIARVLLLALFVIVALQNLGVELLPLIAGLSVAGAGIALAMQGVLGDLVAGLSIIFNKPFRIGDYISIAGEEGRVETISLFSTALGNPDRSQIVIPNHKIAGEILHNFGQMRQLDVVVGVAYDTDLGAAHCRAAGVAGREPEGPQEPCARHPDGPARGLEREHQRAAVGAGARLRSRHERDQPVDPRDVPKPRNRHSVSAPRRAAGPCSRRRSLRLRPPCGRTTPAGALFEPHAVRVVGHRRRPVGEDSEDADVARKHVERLVHVAVLLHRPPLRIEAVVEPAESGAAAQIRALERSR